MHQSPDLDYSGTLLGSAELCKFEYRVNHDDLSSEVVMVGVVSHLHV